MVRHNHANMIEEESSLLLHMNDTAQFSVADGQEEYKGGHDSDGPTRT